MRSVMLQINEYDDDDDHIASLPSFIAFTFRVSDISHQMPRPIIVWPTVQPQTLPNPLKGLVETTRR